MGRVYALSSPTMRTVSNAIREVKPALKDLRDSVQDVSLKGFRPGY